MVRGIVPREYRWRTRAWQGDLDAFGEMRYSALLQLLQEAATRASADAGFDPSYYERSGTQWVVRRTSVLHPLPIRYGDALDVRTWVADFRRVRSYRDYEVSVDGRRVAQGRTDWVYVDRHQGRPRSIPEEMQRVLLPDGGTIRSRHSPSVAAPGSGTTMTSRRVELRDLDGLRHVNNSVYIDYLEEAAMNASAARGWPFERQVAAGVHFRAVAHDLEHLDSALYDDPLSIVTWPIEVSATSLVRGTVMTRENDGCQILRARSRYDWLDARCGDHVAMPAEIARALTT